MPLLDFFSPSPTKKRKVAAQPSTRRPIVSGNIFNSNGTHVGVVIGPAIFNLDGQKLYGLKGANIYRLSGELVGHLSDASGSDKRLDRSTEGYSH